MRYKIYSTVCLLQLQGFIVIIGLWRLTVLTSVLSMLPLTAIHLLPIDAEHQERLSKSKKRSKLGGVLFLTVLGLSLAWSIGSAVAELVSAWTE